MINFFKIIEIPYKMTSPSRQRLKINKGEKIMSTKVKLASLISAFVLVLAIMMVAVMAVPTVTLNIGGNISFTATDLQVTISQGVLVNGTVEDSANKMQGVKIDAYNDGAEELATWTNLELTFDESGQDMTITFTITNNSKVDDIRATVTVDQGTTDNATVSVTTPSSSSVRIPANDGSQQFVVTFHINNRNDSASIENFEINIDLEKYESQVYDYFDFEVNSDGSSVTLTSFDEDLADTTDIEIPATVSLEDGTWVEGNSFIVTAIADGLSEGGEYTGVFYNSGITSIKFPSTLTSIGNCAFQECHNLIGSLDLSNCINLTNIGYLAFFFCDGLTGELRIPEGVTSIGYQAFEYCFGFTGTLTLPSTLISIGNYVFNGCQFIDLNLSNCTNLTSIGQYAFQNINTMKDDLIIPEGVTSIGDGAFYECGLFNSVIVNCTTPPTIGADVFDNTIILTNIYVPAESVDLYKSASGWSTYANIITAIV